MERDVKECQSRRGSREIQKQKWKQFWWTPCSSEEGSQQGGRKKYVAFWENIWLVFFLKEKRSKAKFVIKLSIIEMMLILNALSSFLQ